MNFSEVKDIHDCIVNFAIDHNIDPMQLKINEELVNYLMSMHNLTPVKPNAALYWLQHYGLIEQVTQSGYRLL